MRIRRIFLLIALALIPLAGRTQLFEFPPSEPLELHRPLTNEARQQQRSAAQLENRGESAKALAIYRQLFDLYPEYDPFYEGIIRCLMTGEQYDLGLSFIDSLRRGLTAQVSLQNLKATSRIDDQKPRQKIQEFFV